jgi:hypothetical protein
MENALALFGLKLVNLISQGVMTHNVTLDG